MDLFFIKKSPSGMVYTICGLLLVAGCTGVSYIQNGSYLPEERVIVDLSQKWLVLRSIDGDKKYLFRNNVRIELAPGEHIVELHCQRTVIDYSCRTQHYSSPYTFSFSGEPGAMYSLSAELINENKGCRVTLRNNADRADPDVQFTLNLDKKKTSAPVPFIMRKEGFDYCDEVP